eukprot:4540914-Amphidinium_carterae.1
MVGRMSRSNSSTIRDCAQCEKYTATAGANANRAKLLTIQCQRLTTAMFNCCNNVSLVANGQQVDKSHE